MTTTELRELIAKATPGPWYAVGPLSEEEACRTGGTLPTIAEVNEENEPVEIATFDEVRHRDLAVVLRNLAPLMLDVVEAAEKAMKDRDPDDFDALDAALAALHTRKGEA